MNVFFTSDTHFLHKNIIKYDNLPFNDIYEKRDVLIKNWNSVVKEGDMVFHLGDFSINPRDSNRIPSMIQELVKIRNQLNGDITLIKGNHDDHLIQYKKELKFFNIYSYKEIMYKDINFVLFHYPIESWKGIGNKHIKTIHLHGHTHNKNEKIIKFRKNCNIFLNNFTPINVDNIINEYNL